MTFRLQRDREDFNQNNKTNLLKHMYLEGPPSPRMKKEKGYKDLFDPEALCGPVGLKY